jgi:hypothetical protein
MIPQLHPACAAWPVMPEKELLELAHDIEKNQLKETIVTMPDGSLLDGRCRWLACEIVAVTPRTRLFGSETSDGDDPIRFVLSKNKLRRHMSYAEKCFVGDTLANLADGERKSAAASKEAGANPITQDEAALALGISRSGTQDARVIREVGGPEVVEEVKTGKRAIRAIATAMRAKRKKANGGAPVAAPRGKQPDRSKRIDPPYLKLEVATDEETDRPAANVLSPEFDRWRKKHGKVPLYSTKGRDLLNCDDATGQFVQQLVAIASVHQPDPEIFFKHIDQMLAHVPQRGKTNGEEIDFAKNARASLVLLGRDLDTAIQRLTTFRTMLAQRASAKCQRSKQKGSPHKDCIGSGSKGISAVRHQNRHRYGPTR